VASNGIMTLNAHIQNRENNRRPFNITGGKVIWTGDFLERITATTPSSIVSGGSLEIRGGTYEGSSSTIAANKIPFLLSGTGELTINGGRVVANANDAGAHCVSITGLTAKLKLKGGAELITTNASAKDVFIVDAVATDVHIYGDNNNVTNVAVADVNVVVKGGGTMFRSATDIS